ncbi:MAG: DUF1573 domain-containing protein [Bacteroidales bacterium]|nr:DUF1573 domain-containing protein [Bacteroidales bacterium]
MRIRLFAVSFLVIFCITHVVFAQDAVSYWKQFTGKKICKSQSVTFKSKSVILYPIIPDIEPKNFSFSFDSLISEVVTQDIKVRADRDTLWIVDPWTGNISICPKEANYRGINLYTQYRNSYFSDFQKVVPFYYYIGDCDFMGTPLSFKDTVIKNANYHLLQVKVFMHLTLEDDGTIDSSFCNVMYYCNDDKSVVDRIDVDHGIGLVVSHTFDDIVFSDKRIEWDNLVTDSLIEAGYRTYIAPDDAAPSEIGNYIGDTVIIDKLNDFPLVTTGGDTVFFKDIKGWKLLDIWIYHCIPCAAFHEELRKEKEINGFRSLEKDGVRVLCINGTGGMTDKLREYSEKYDIADITYSGMAIRDILGISSYPKYFLFSPKGELVFSGFSSDVTDTVIALKRKYDDEHALVSSPVISFDEKEYDFGTINKDSAAIHVFRFKNIGDAPLVVDRTSTSCGCTAAEFDNTPVSPGGYGEVTVRYDTTKEGSFKKAIVVVSNAVNENKTVLFVSGKVVK